MSQLARATDETTKAKRPRPGRRVVRVELAGELDHEALLEVTRTLGRLLEAGAVRVVMDFGAVGHLDYRGLRPLARAAEVLREAGGDVRLARLSPGHLAVLRGAGVDAAFDTFASVDDAVASFDRGIFVSLR